MNLDFPDNEYGDYAEHYVPEEDIVLGLLLRLGQPVFTGDTITIDRNIDTWSLKDDIIISKLAKHRPYLTYELEDEYIKIKFNKP